MAFPHILDELALLISAIYFIVHPLASSIPTAHIPDSAINSHNSPGMLKQMHQLFGKADPQIG